MKINELQLNNDYKNSFIVLTEELAKTMPSNLTESREVIEEYSSVKVKINDHSHFLDFLQYIPKDTSFIIEDGDQKYIVINEFANKV